MTTHYLVVNLPDDNHEASALLNARRVDGWHVSWVVPAGYAGEPTRLILEHTPRIGDGS